MKIQKLLIKVFLCATLIFLPSCVTKYIWGDKSYQERINQFFIGVDGRYVVLIGENYHYIFTDNSAVLKEVLSLSQQNVLAIDSKKTHLKLDSKNEIKGDFVIEGPASLLPFQDLQILRSYGFFPDKNDNILIKTKLTGRRYAARYLGQNVSSLKSPHVLSVYYSDSNLVKGVGKAAITPIAVTLDAVLLIGKVAIYPFSL
jgi:hypothetical protein